MKWNKNAHFSKRQCLRIMTILQKIEIADFNFVIKNPKPLLIMSSVNSKKWFADVRSVVIHNISLILLKLYFYILNSFQIFKKKLMVWNIWFTKNIFNTFLIKKKTSSYAFFNLSYRLTFCNSRLICIRMNINMSFDY